jgi:transposase
MPAPLTEVQRSRVLDLQYGVSEAARRAGVSRQTVHRYRQAAARAVPRPRPAGGYRVSRLERTHIQLLGRLAVEQPKRTLEELRQLAEAQGAPHVSAATVARALHKCGLRKRRARHVDPKTSAHPFIAAERAAFRRAQRTLSELQPERLLFFDETVFRLNEQASMAWGPAQGAPPILHRPKGRTATTGLLLTLGVQRNGQPILHAELKPPQRAYQRLGDVYEANELAEPGQGVDVGFSEAELPRARVRDLRAALVTHGVRHTDLRHQADLVSRVQQLARHGPLGLPRAGRADRGGPLQPFRATTRDVARYWEHSFAPWWRRQAWDDRLCERTVVWDNASTHSAVDVHDSTRVSVFHRLFREWGLAGVAFLPPRSPAFNPAELCFAFLKQWVRKRAPDEGYTQAGLEAAIQEALARVTGAMITNWIHGCGYGAARVGAVVRQRHAIDVTPRWADAHGTLHAVRAHGLEDIAVRAPPRPAVPHPPASLRRWPGYPAGSQPPGLTETQPTSLVEAMVDDETVFEPERIVDERQLGDGTVQYRIRWKGYDPSSDTWEPLEHLLAGRRQLLRDWKKRARARA